MGSAITEPCYVCIVRSEYVRPGCCGSISVRALYRGVRRCEDSTHPFANGTGGHPLSWPSLPLEGGHPLFSQIENGRKVEGSKLFSEGNHLRQLISFHCPHPLLRTFRPGASSIYSRGLDGRLFCPPSVSTRERIVSKSALPARNNSRRGRYPSWAFGGISVCPVAYWGGWRVM